jgi:hypothetical protein
MHHTGVTGNASRKTKQTGIHGISAFHGVDYLSYFDGRHFPGEDKSAISAACAENKAFFRKIS